MPTVQEIDEVITLRKNARAFDEFEIIRTQEGNVFSYTAQRRRDKEIAGIYIVAPGNGFGSYRCSKEPELADWFLVNIVDKIHFELQLNFGPLEQFAKDDKPAKSKKGPTARTMMRYEAIKAVKEAHRDWTQERVAGELTVQERTDVYTVNTIRNTYNAMGAKWERADRIR